MKVRTKMLCGFQPETRAGNLEYKSNMLSETSICMIAMMIIIQVFIFDGYQPK